MNNAPAKKERVVAFDCLRGLSIALIVLGHSIFLAQPHFPSLLENLFIGGTGLFVFISGFFFHRVFYSRFNYSSFIHKKASALLIPFVVISLFGLAMRMLGWWQDGLAWQANLLHAWHTLSNGYVLYPHWYIPFIFLTFLCSPLHIAFIRLPLWPQLIITLLFAIIALLIHRPDSGSNFLQSLVYFTSYYLLGILVSLHEPWLRRWHWPLMIICLTIAACAAVAQTYIWVHFGNYHKPAFTYDGLDLHLLQMLFGCIGMLELCRHIQSAWLQRHLCWLANLSFPIFFIHPLLSMALSYCTAGLVLQPLFPTGNSGASCLVFTLVFIIQLYGSALIALAIQRLTGSRSRYLIG